MLALLKPRESSATVLQAQYLCELKLFYYEVRIRTKMRRRQAPITIKKYTSCELLEISPMCMKGTSHLVTDTDKRGTQQFDIKLLAIRRSFFLILCTGTTVMFLVRNRVMLVTAAGIVFSGNFPTPLVSIVTSLIHITLLPSAQLLCSFNARSTVRCTHLNLHEMSLQIIDEDNTLEPLANCETQPHGRTGRGFHANRPNDNVSIFSHSTNSTVSNLVGTGQVLGNVYSYTGKRLERALGDIAHRVGFGPEAIYVKICSLGWEDWIRDDEKGNVIQNVQIAC